MASNNYIIALLAIVVVVVFGYVIYTMGRGLIKEENPAELVFNMIEKPSKYSNYTYEYIEMFDDYPVSTRMVRTPSFSLVSVKSPVFEKVAYEANGTKVLCIAFANEKRCSSLSQDSIMMPSFNMLVRLLFERRVWKDVKAMKIYNRSGAVKFDNEIKKSSVEGKPCKLVRYTLDYSKLTFADLEELGLSPNDPALLYSKNYTFEYCIDENNDALSIKLDYIFMGKKRSTETILKEAKWGVADIGEFSLPPLVNESQTESLFLDAISAEKTVLACSNNANTKDTCIRNYAVNNNAPDICLLAGTNKDKCILMLAPNVMRIDLCEKVDNSSYKDDCWVEMAARTNNNSLCANVNEATKKSYCDSLLANITNSSNNSSE